jgi:hypothetical protein
LPSDAKWKCKRDKNEWGKNSGNFCTIGIFNRKEIGLFLLDIFRRIYLAGLCPELFFYYLHFYFWKFLGI